VQDSKGLGQHGRLLAVLDAIITASFAVPFVIDIVIVILVIDIIILVIVVVADVDAVVSINATTARFITTTFDRTGWLPISIFVPGKSIHCV
jgi:hypothetical protein